MLERLWEVLAHNDEQSKRAMVLESCGGRGAGQSRADRVIDGGESEERGRGGVGLLRAD